MPESIRDKLESEKVSITREVVSGLKPVEPTEDEKRNGWTSKTLTAYLASRQAGQSMAVDINSLHRQMTRRKDEQNHKYSPLRWRG